jgi:hypothetical protein
MLHLRPSRWLALVIALVLVTGAVGAPATVTQAQDGGEYTYSVVGGVDLMRTYPDHTVDGFEFTNLTYHSNYPRGLEFRATITPPEGVTYNQVMLVYTFSTGKRSRMPARPGDAPNEWVAIPYEGLGLPPWHEMDVVWGVRGADGLSVDSEPLHAVYYDASREWFRAESEDVIVYWFGMPEELGRYVIEAMAGNREKYLQGFGELLPFRPTAVIFPPGPSWNEYKGEASIDDTDFGFTGTIIPEAGSTIQRVRTLEPAAIRADCIWNPAEPTLEFQLSQAASTTVHEVAHLYQHEVGVSGPSWWVEGQATFFETFDEYPVHDRLSTLYTLMDRPFPTLQGDGPGGGALTVAEDGCTHLMYDMGSSFMRWIAEAHGGLDTYRAIVDEMALGYPLAEALETATGLTFLELENEWRAFLGIPPVPAEQLDPGLALDEPVEPYFAVGEEVTTPAMPFQTPMYGAPSEKSVADAACFASTAVTVLRAGNDGTVNWYEVDCMGMVGWMNHGQLVGP